MLCLWWLKSLHTYANRNTGDPGSPATLHNEVNTTPREFPTGTEADIPAGLLADNHTTATPKAIAPPIAQAIAHHPASPTDPITSKHPTGTPRTLLTSYSLTVL